MREKLILKAAGKDAYLDEVLGIDEERQEYLNKKFNSEAKNELNNKGIAHLIAFFWNEKEFKDNEVAGALINLGIHIGERKAVNPANDLQKLVAALKGRL